MRKFTIAVLLAMLVSVASVGCKEKDGDTGTGTSGTGTSGTDAGTDAADDDTDSGTTTP